MKQFDFRGGAFDFFVESLIATLIVSFTFGIATPWAVVRIKKWECENTTFEGRRMRFVGSGGDLFGKFIVWFLLTIVTFGIYSFWLTPKMLQWTYDNTIIED